MKAGRGFWKTDWFLGVIVVIAVFVIGRTDLMDSLENKAYDMAASMSSKAPSSNIAIIAIDDDSIANIGRWPWSREVHAKMIDLLAGAHAKVIGNSIFYFEPQRDAGLNYIDKLVEIYNRQVPTGADAANPGATLPASQGADFTQFGSILKQAEVDLNTDHKVAESITKAGNVVLPMAFVLGEPQGRPDTPVPDFVAKNAVAGASASSFPAKAMQAPIEEIGRGAAAIGFLNTSTDADGGVRTDPLTITYFDHEYPSMALMLAAKSLNLGVADIKQTPGESVTLGGLTIKTDGADRMLTHYYPTRDNKPPFQIDSFYDVLSGKIPADKYAGKIVLIGANAQGVGITFPTPVSAGMSPVEILAHTVSSILTQQYFTIPWWSVLADAVIFLLVAAYLIVLLPRLRAGMAASLTGAALVVLVGAHFGLMLSAGMWLHLMLPATLLLIGHLALTTKRFLVTEAGKDKSDLESAESNRMLGLAFQGQGQLDMAYEKFRKCPLDDAVMENLYNLALDFERKRQFNKAQAVYEYMSKYNPNFRDLPNKLSRAKTMSETIILGGSSSRSNASLISADGGSVEKPMLGRYQVEKELGKGAMGVVYLGKDPKIGRVVAIKTMALAQEFEPDELQDVKERFFREAETAGRLNHPYIVTIFDAGEEHDLAYIAMEFLKGKDLVPYTKFDALLPVEKVVSIHARVAEALAYAHRQNVVHRDIKPANMMYELESDTVKVTDFGIARITDSSKTKTGMVLGTPSYMSPEQLSGQKIDGRSDLFSLTVSLYQMTCGQLPFVGDSMAQLMFKIANEEAADIRTRNPAIPEALARVIAKGMSKDINLRYQNGDEMAADLRAAFGLAQATSPGMTSIQTAPVAMAAPAAAPAAPVAARPAAPAAADPMQATVVNRPAAPAAADAMAATIVSRPPAPVAAPVAPPVAAPVAPPVEAAQPRAADPNIKTVVDPYDPFTKTDVLPAPEEGKKEGAGDVDFEF